MTYHLSAPAPQLREPIADRQIDVITCGEDYHRLRNLLDDTLARLRDHLHHHEVEADAARRVDPAVGRRYVSDLARWIHEICDMISEESSAVEPWPQVIGNVRGTTAIEYSLICALISIACISVWSTVGTALSTTFATVATNL